MVPRILIINERKVDVHRITNCFSYSPIFIVDSSAEAILTIRLHHIDLIFILLNHESKILPEFYSTLKNILLLTPIIGIINDSDSLNYMDFMKNGIDEFIFLNIEAKDLLRSVNALMEAKKKVYSKLLQKRSLGLQDNGKIAIFSSEKVLSFLSADFLNHMQVFFFEEEEFYSLQNSIDIFLIDIANNNFDKTCAEIRLNDTHKHKPILLLHDEEHKILAESYFSRGLEINDLICKAAPAGMNACKVNAHIKYRRLIDDFYKKVKGEAILSEIDALTNVYNRRFLDDYLKRNEYIAENSAILMIDLDKFKNINDKYGHSTADNIIRLIAQRMKSFIRKTDMLIRYGGDEFLIIMNNITRPEVEGIVKRLIEGISQQRFEGIHCSISVGGCYANVSDVSTKEAIFVADSCMYMSKQKGGDVFHICP